MEIHSTAAILAEKKGKILLIRRLSEPERGWWAVPGGHVDEGETPKEAAVREAAEEIRGVRVEGDAVLVFEHDVPEGDRRCADMHKHLCHTFMGVPEREIKTGSDAGDYIWIAPQESLDMKITDWTRTIVVWLLGRK
jgi:8-oxo-dGTP diphosphatase